MMQCRGVDCEMPAAWIWTPPLTRIRIPLCDDDAAGIDLDELEEIARV